MAISKIIPRAIAWASPPRNYIVNGAMQVSQENGTAAGTTDGYYPVDQFVIGKLNDGAVSVAQVASATPGGSPTRVRVTVTSVDTALAAGQYLFLAQLVEGLQVADLRYGSASAKTITVQFGVKAPAGTYSVSIRNSAADRSYIAEFVISAGEANTDVVKSVTIPGDTAGTWLTTNGIGLRLLFVLASNSNLGTAGSWSASNVWASSGMPSGATNFMGTNSQVFELFDVSLTQGSVAPAFQVPNYAEQLALCQRYWFPIQSAAYVFPAPGATYAFNFRYEFPSSMRAAPTVTTTYSGQANVSSTAASVRTTDFFTEQVSATGAGNVSFTLVATANSRL